MMMCINELPLILYIIFICKLEISRMKREKERRGRKYHKPYFYNDRCEQTIGIIRTIRES